MAHSAQGLKEDLASPVDCMSLTSGFSGHRTLAREVHLKRCAVSMESLIS